MNFTGRIKNFWDNEVLKVALAVVLSRVVLLVLSYVFYLMREPSATLAQFGEWLSQTGDVSHYIRIAQNGYSVGDEYQNLVVFYPLFPMLMKVVGIMVGNHMVAGMIISNVCAVVAGCYMYRLVRMEYSAQTSAMAVLFMFLYPFSFFMSFCYTESLFIMLCIMSVYYAVRGKWAACGVTGFLGALCRTQGVVLFGVALYELVVQARTKVQAESFAQGVKSFFKKLPLSGLFTLLIPAGYGVYLTINKVLFGDWFKFLEFQQAAPWYQTAGFIPENLHQQLNMAIDYPYLSFIIYIPQVIIFIVAFAMILVGVKYKVRTSYLLHIAAYTIASYLSTWLISGGRYMLSCFMMFIPMALLARNKVWRFTLIVLLAGLNLFMFYLYIMGYAIM